MVKKMLLRNGIRSFGSFKYVLNSFIFKEPSLFASKGLKDRLDLSLHMFATLQQVVELLDVVSLLLHFIR